MKEESLALIEGMTDTGQARNRLREYLQAFALRSFHESEAFRAVAFVGGTALRFLHNLPRFSEDLDFSLVSEAGYAGRDWMAKLKRDLVFAGFTPEVTWNDRKTVHTGWVRLAGLLHEAGLSGHPAEKLSIKVEIDTRPPAGAHCERRVVTRHLTFLVNISTRRRSWRASSMPPSPVSMSRGVTGTIWSGTSRNVRRWRRT